MFLQTQWVDLFPTIVTKARTIEVIENGALGSRDGSLQLVSGHIHIENYIIYIPIIVGQQGRSYWNN